MSLRLDNKSKYAGRTGDTDWWKWTAFIEGDKEDLDAVDYVEYHLHPGFPDPIKRVRNRSRRFAMTTQGWGTFELKAKVVFKDKKRKAMVLKHYLEFEDAQ